MSDATKQVDALLNGNRGRGHKTCSLCDSPRTVQIQTRLARVNEHGRVDGKTATTAALFCDEHAVAVFGELRSVMMGGGS